MKKEAENILKYEDLRNTAHLECNNKSDTRPNGNVSESFRFYVNKIPGGHEIKEMLKQPYEALLACFGKYHALM
jgi:hypothetical protein